MAKKAGITVHPEYEIGSISPRLYGCFLEPIDSFVNGSMFNPSHPSADEHGFRRDFLEELREAKLPCIRLPGGNYISGWEWDKSIGPKEYRHRVLDPAWHQYVTNEVGHDEYLQWAIAAGMEPMYTINLGTGTIKDAMHIIEYTNHPGGTYWSDLRAKYGHKDPYKVKTWYLGNEMDGCWQIGSWEKDPHGFGVLTNEVSKAMKFIDGSIETVACVSSSPFSVQYPQWDYDVLNECYENVDYISLHHYHSAPPGNWAAFYAGSSAYEDYIRTELAVCDTIKTKVRSRKTMLISFDEYECFIRESRPVTFGKSGHPGNEVHFRYNDRPYEFIDPNDWSNHNRVRPGGDMAQALSDAAIMLTFLRHADRVKIGCNTFGLEAAVATDRDHIWKKASRYILDNLIRYGQGISLRPEVKCEVYDVPTYAMDDFAQYDRREGVKYIEAAAAIQEEKGEMTVFAVNLDWEEMAELTLDARGFEEYEFIEHIELYADELGMCNTYTTPNAIIPHTNRETHAEDGKLTAALKKSSWNMFRFEKSRK